MLRAKTDIFMVLSKTELFVSSSLKKIYFNLFIGLGCHINQHFSSYKLTIIITTTDS